MNRKSIITICFVLCLGVCRAQWEVGLGVGIGLPITGYKEVVKTGWLLNAEGKYRFKSNWAVGIKTQFTRLQKDKDPNDAFQDARITVAPLLFTAEYGGFSKGNLQPYVGGGLGISFFSVNYETTPTEGTSEFNVSFTMMPQVGLRYAASQNLYPFIESGLVLLADGPPIGFPKGEQLTGYGFINLGVHYQFR